jgi:hypothetical protein
MDSEKWTARDGGRARAIATGAAVMLFTNTHRRFRAADFSCGGGAWLKENHMLRPLLSLIIVFGTLVATGCKGPQLNAEQTDGELHMKIDENFKPGMTKPQVLAKLSELGVSDRNNEWYDVPPAPPQLMVRMYGGGGFWMDDQDTTVTWVDAVFVFGREQPEPLYARTETFRGSQRYWNGDPVNPPMGATKYPWERFPMPPPPPADPPVR